MIKFIEQEMGPLKVFRLPEPGMSYTIGTDGATGLGNDYSCTQVLTNTIPSVQVAVLREQSPVNEFTKKVNMIGRFYNEALNVCEINYPGNSIQDALLQFYAYPKNYQPETHLETDVDVAEKYGFRTTEASKWLLINEMQMALENKGIIIYDMVTLSEMSNFVYQSQKNKAGAASGFNDDCVMALMLAFHGASLYPTMMQIEGLKKKASKVDADTKKAWKNFKRHLVQDKEGIVL